MNQLGVSVGDSILAGAAESDSNVELTVVGTAVIPPEETDPGDGALFTPEGLPAVRAR